MKQNNKDDPEIQDQFEDDVPSYKKDNNERPSPFLNGLTIVVSEFIGTAILVYITCMGCTVGMFDETIPVLQLSLASGLSVMAVIQAFGHISGAHVNPAITICAVIMGEISLTSAPIYVCSQIAGSLTGYALLVAVTPDEHLYGSYGHCVTIPHHDITLIQACAVEAIATFVMAFGVCASWDPRNSAKNEAVPLKIGLIVVLLNITAGAYTGASMNPVRSFGPALWNQSWNTHWVYWLGPIIGASVTGQLYKSIFLKQQQQQQQ